MSQLMDVLDGQYTADSYAEIPLEQALRKYTGFLSGKWKSGLIFSGFCSGRMKSGGLWSRRIFSDCWGAGRFGFRFFGNKV
ncbi:MAG: hypothetical protein V8R80_01460 [Eubacterium sp.]